MKEKVFFICETLTGECMSFPATNFTEAELDIISKFGKELSENAELVIKVGYEEEFFE